MSSSKNSVTGRWEIAKFLLGTINCVTYDHCAFRVSCSTAMSMVIRLDYVARLASFFSSKSKLLLHYQTMTFIYWGEALWINVIRLVSCLYSVILHMSQNLVQEPDHQWKILITKHNKTFWERQRIRSNQWACQNVFSLYISRISWSPEWKTSVLK